MLAILFAGIAIEGALTWVAYDQTFGARAASKDWLHRKVSSYSVDAYDELLAVRRLQIYCLRFAAKSLPTDQFNLLRRQVVGASGNVAPGSFLASEWKSEKNFAAAYEAVHSFLLAAQGLENGTVGIDNAYARGEEAAAAWGAFSQEVVAREFALHDDMEKAIVEFRPLAVRSFLLIGGLVALCAIATLTAAYSGWRALRAERQRFDRFELLLATVGHDLRSPLQALVGAAKLAAADALPAERMKFVQIVHERSAFFTRLLDDLIDLARSESLSFVPEPVDLRGWFDAAVWRYRQAVEAKGLSFNASLDASPPWIMFDPHRLTQCTDNLMTNAVRYTDHGKVDLVVRLESEVQPERSAKLIIEVTDTGRGIAEADQARIFEPFVRIDSSVQGMGVGLSMVQRLARRVGGSASVRSAPGQGSTFAFTVPVRLATEAKQAEASTAPPEATLPGTAASPGKTALAVPRVLVVDDDPLITQVVAGLLPHMGFAADVAVGGRAGLAMAKTQPYCAVITDVQMPGLDGFELARALRAHARAGAKPCPMLIALTAYTAQPQADERGPVFDATLRKPFDDIELAELLDRAAIRWTELTS